MIENGPLSERAQATIASFNPMRQAFVDEVRQEIRRFEQSGFLPEYFQRRNLPSSKVPLVYVQAFHVLDPEGMRIIRKKNGIQGFRLEDKKDELRWDIRRAIERAGTEINPEIAQSILTVINE